MSITIFKVILLALAVIIGILIITQNNNFRTAELQAGPVAQTQVVQP